MNGTENLNEWDKRVLFNFDLIGDVAHVDVLKNQDGRSKGCAVVFFDHPEDAEKAIGTPTAVTLPSYQLWAGAI